MKIADVHAHALSFPLQNAPRRGAGQPVKKDMVLVKVTTEDGIVGWGEAHHALDPTIVAALVNQNLAPVVRGADAFAYEDLWQLLYTKQGQTHQDHCIGDTLQHPQTHAGNGIVSRTLMAEQADAGGKLCWHSLSMLNDMSDLSTGEP